MRVVVTGGGGLLAAAIVREFAKTDEVTAFDRTALDVSDRAACERLVTGSRPDVVINCAAYNDVDGAESDPVTAINVNALAVRGLAAVTRACDTIFVHYGTDFVFDGEATRPYTEDDPPNPRGVYAASKLLGDWFALDHPRSYALRVESLFGEPGPAGRRRGSMATIVARIRAREPVPTFTDRTVSPTYTTDIATATRALLTGGAPPGLYHCVNTGSATWAEIATEVGRILGVVPHIQPITLATVALKAPRPKYCVLSNGKLASAGIAMPMWQDALRRHLSRF